MRMMSVMASAYKVDAARIVGLYDGWTAQWHAEAFPSWNHTARLDAFDAAVRSLHQANFELWHEEDKARDAEATDAEIAAAKRSIDRINQRRNDQMERCDALLLEELARLHLPYPDAELHSETPGLMLDRLSILSLKHYHTLEELARINAPNRHQERNRERLTVLESQRKDLVSCLDLLWQRVMRGERRFVLYRQLKMYNDPDLNPILYQRSKQ